MSIKINSLDHYLSQAPDWSLRLDARNTVVDLESTPTRRSATAAATILDLEVNHLFHDRFAPVCRPLLQISAPRDLAQATRIQFERGTEARYDARACVLRHWIGASLPGFDTGTASSGGLSFTEELHAVQATIAGQRAGQLSLALVQDKLDSGVLVQPFDLELDSFSYDLVYSPRALERPATLLLREWVHSQFAKR